MRKIIISIFFLFLFLVNTNAEYVSTEAELCSSNGTICGFRAEKDNGNCVFVINGIEGIEHKCGRAEKIGFSPDGNNYAYLISKDKGAAYIINGNEEKTFNNVGLGGVKFSPDSKRYMYVTDLGIDKASIVVDGNEEKTYSSIYGIDFSPDSQHYVYHFKRSTDGKTGVVINGREVRYDYNNSSFRYISGFSYNSQFYSYKARNSENNNVKIIILKIEGGVASLFYESESYKNIREELIFSPNSQRFAFIGEKENKTHVVVVDGKESKEYSFHPSPIKFQFSQDSTNYKFEFFNHGTNNYQILVNGKEDPYFGYIKSNSFSFTENGGYKYQVEKRDPFLKEVWIVNGVEQTEEKQEDLIVEEKVIDTVEKEELVEKVIIENNIPTDIVTNNEETPKQEQNEIINTEQVEITKEIVEQNEIKNEEIIEENINLEEKQENIEEEIIESENIVNTEEILKNEIIEEKKQLINPEKVLNFTNFIKSPKEISKDIKVIGTNGILSILYIFLFYFISSIFNNLYQDEKISKLSINDKITNIWKKLWSNIYKTLRKFFGKIIFIESFKNFYKNYVEVFFIKYSHKINVIIGFLTLGIISQIIVGELNLSDTNGIFELFIFIIVVGVFALFKDLLIYISMKRQKKEKVKIHIISSGFIILSIVAIFVNIFKIIPGVLFGNTNRLRFGDKKTLKESENPLKLLIVLVIVYIVGIGFWFSSLIFPENTIWYKLSLTNYFAIGNDVFFSLLPFSVFWGKNILENKKLKRYWFVFLFISMFTLFHTIINPQGDFSKVSEISGRNLLIFSLILVIWGLITFLIWYKIFRKNRKIILKR